MKITELRCTACNGTLMIDEKNPNYAECEYCHTRYTIEWDKPQGRGSAQEEEAHLKPMTAGTMPKIEYQVIPDPVEKKRTGWEYDGWKRLLACMVALLAIIAVWRGPAIIKRYQMDHPRQPETVSGPAGMTSEMDSGGAGTFSQTGSGNAGAENASAQKAVLDGILADFAEAVFGKPVEDITGDELAKIAWLETRSTIDNRKIGYSFASPVTDPEAELTWILFPRDDYREIDPKQLRNFTGIKVLGPIGTTVTAEDVEGLDLEGISGYYHSLEEVAACVSDPSKLKRVEMTGSPASLKGLELLTGLTSLSITADSIEEEKTLAAAKNLKEISLDMYDGSMDFSVFGVMPWLESLTIESQNLRDISFVTKIESLKSLKLTYGTFLSLEPLEGLTGLKTLSLQSCDEINDMSPIGSLTGLKELTLELPYGCEAPDLGGLSGLEKLYLDGFEETGFLRNMTNLRELTLDGCPVSSPEDFAGLQNLKVLRCTAFGYMEQDYSFITELPVIETVDLHGTITYGDLAGIFNLPTLKSLNISGMECGIGFDEVEANTTLEELYIDDVTLYTNVQISGGGGIYSVDWDPVSLTEHLDFLSKFSGLKKLSIRSNELTDLNFVSGLPGLESIDFGDNYVSDLAPLSALKALRQVNCEDNPASNFSVLGDSVIVVR